ncbi:MAG: hypothetical protein SPK09_03315 [Porphyromonas sp.]|nr:hypothetical protein [Porphyromonas sp.]
MTKDNNIETRSRINVELWLTIAFYLLALATLLSFFLVREDYPRLFVYFGCAAVGVRIIYYVKRYLL